MKHWLLTLSVWLSVGWLANARYVSPGPRIWNGEIEKNSGGDVNVLWAAGTPTTGSAAGPTSQGTTGSIKCVFTAHSQVPATSWWVDSPTKPTIPTLVHSVTAQPGSPVTGFTAGAHTVYFSVTGANTAPGPFKVSVGDDSTCIVYVTYN